MIQVCNDILQHTFCTLRPKSLGRFLQDTEHIARGKDIWLVVAYEDPWALDWLLRMAARHVTGGPVLVFDNSRRAQLRDDIRNTCQNHGVPYLALPPAPTAHPNRSHGMAMTWIFRNIVRTVRPRTFSFIDHDLIPMETIGRRTMLENQPFYGAINTGKNDGTWGWNLWAGYCSYDFSAVHHLPLNFLNDFSRDLDTGGRNWPILYQKFDRGQLRFAPRLLTNIIDPLRKTPHAVPVVDDRWIHLCGAGYSKRYRDRVDFYRHLAQATDEDESVVLDNIMWRS
ncbi:MAG TPA: hypothetical protein PKZ42_02525 [Syntrophales bacterium]|nr:hypothetical protein [Syntrophales bacterium]